MRCSQRSINSVFSNCGDGLDLQDSWDIPWTERQPKVLNLCKRIWPTADHDLTDARPLGKGSFNIAIAISIVISGKREEYVLRLPDWEGTLVRSAGILRYLNHKTDLKVPKVISFDTTVDNEIEYPYMLLTRIPGVSLDSVMGTLTQEQKVLLAEDLGKTIMQIQAIKSPVAGQIRTHASEFNLESSDIDDHIYVQALGTEMSKRRRQNTDWEDDEWCFIIPKERLLKDPKDLPVKDVMLGMFQRRVWRAMPPAEPFLLYSTDKCLNIVKEMVNDWLFDDDTISLLHGDLFPRNIMVDFTQRPVITGVIDWDESEFAPTFVSAEYPRWLWRTDYTDYDDHEPNPLDGDALVADTPENKIVQDTFDAQVSPEWLERATDPRYMLARTLYWFIRKPDVYNGNEMDEADEFTAKWKEIKSHHKAVSEEETKASEATMDDYSSLESLSNGTSDGTDRSSESTPASSPEKTRPGTCRLPQKIHFGSLGSIAEDLQSIPTTPTKRAPTETLIESSAKKPKINSAKDVSLAGNEDLPANGTKVIDFGLTGASGAAYDHVADSPLMKSSNELRSSGDGLVQTEHKPEKKSQRGIRSRLAEMTRFVRRRTSGTDTRKQSEAPCNSTVSDQGCIMPTADQDTSSQRPHRVREVGKQIMSWCSRKGTWIVRSVAGSSWVMTNQYPKNADTRTWPDTPMWA